MIVVGLYRYYSGDIAAIPPNETAIHELTGGAALTGISVMVLLRAFASGAVALTGVEAIADGVPAFQKPESKNAARTLSSMAIILGTAFFGLALLSNRLHPTASEDETLLSILGSTVFGQGTVLYYVLQFSTFAILILAANTAYADFPRLSSIIARDEFLPHQFKNRGDRLVFSNGIVVLAVMSSVLIIAFGGITTALIPLYAVGVFTGFTLSQAGMVRHHRREQLPGWQRRMVVSGIGAVATGIVLVVVVVSKFTRGAWLPAIVIPAIVVLFKAIGRHYEGVRDEISVTDGWRPRRHTHTVVVLVGSLNKGTLQGISYARSLAPDRLLAVSVVTDDEEANALAEQWAKNDVPVELHTLFSPYRNLTRPMLRFLDELDAESRDDIITVVIPEFVVNRWYLQILHNQTALALKARLLFRPNTVVHVGPDPHRSTPPLGASIGSDGRSAVTTARCCRPPCTRRPSGSSSANPSPRRTSTTSGSGSSSRSRSSPRTRSPPPPTRRTRSWSSSSSRPRSARRPGSTWCRSP